MTPKEKATKLCDLFYQKLPLERYVTTTDGELSWDYNSWQRAKECALIVVDEILWEIIKYADNSREYAVENSLYWQEVKQEIEKL